MKIIKWIGKVIGFIGPKEIVIVEQVGVFLRVPAQHITLEFQLKASGEQIWTTKSQLMAKIPK